MKNKGIILTFIFSFIIFVFVHYINQKENDDMVYNEPIDEIVIDNEIDDPSLEPIEENYREMINRLRQENNNNDIKGILRIPNTTFNSIVPQGKDNSYYLRRLANKKYSRLGSTYLDYRVDIDKSSKLLIYGHNSSKYSMPFEILENYYNKDYYNSHKYIELVTENSLKTYEVFSIYVEVKDYAYYQKMEFDNDDDWYSHIKRMKDKSMYDTGVDIAKDDKILILQTCSTHKDYLKYKKKYLLIISKEVRVDEINEEND